MQKKNCPNISPNHQCSLVKYTIYRIIPCLTLLHQHPSMEDYVWHWYIINGYEQFDNTLMVKTVTYGTWRWFDLATLWDTGK